MYHGAHTKLPLLVRQDTSRNANHPSMDGGGPERSYWTACLRHLMAYGPMLCRSWQPGQVQAAPRPAARGAAWIGSRLVTHEALQFRDETIDATWECQQHASQLGLEGLNLPVWKSRRNQNLGLQYTPRKQKETISARANVPSKL